MSTIVQDVITIGKVLGSHGLVYVPAAIAKELEIGQEIQVKYNNVNYETKVRKNTGDDSRKRIHGLKKLKELPGIEEGVELIAKYDKAKNILTFQNIFKLFFLTLEVSNSHVSW